MGTQSDDVWEVLPAGTARSAHHFCSRFIGQNLVTRPCPTAREAGNCGLAVTQEMLVH